MFDIFPNEKPAPAQEGSELIATVYDPLKAMIIRGILESEEIPYIIKERGAGSSIAIIMGTNYLGTDIYVPSSCVDKVYELLAPVFEGEEVEEEEEEEEDSL